METIYLAIVEYDHEGFDVIRAFRDREAAQTFIEPLKAHRAKHPEYPPLSRPHNSPEWQAYQRAMDEWWAAAPPDFERGDGYDVIETELC